MITTFSASAEEFAATRRKVISDIEASLRGDVAEALSRIGLPSWQRQIVAAALDIFDVTARAEVDSWNQVIDDLREAFELELETTLKATKEVPAESREKQIEAITRWVSQMSHNAAMEAATTSDTSAEVGLEWVCMEDSDVRAPHREAHGQIVPTGEMFSVGGVEMMYPGQPVGDPANWMNCRCVARPTMLAGFTGKTITAAAAAKQGNASDPGLGSGETPSAAVVVLLPRVEDPVTAMASGTHPHCTLLYLGDGEVDLGPLKSIVESVAASFNPLMTDKVSGRATLGEDEADVLLLDASASGIIRAALMAEDGVLELLEMQEQFPAWIPHLTVGYPEAAAEHVDPPQDITYSTLSIWRGNEIYDFPLGGAMPEKKSTGAEEVEDAFAATVEEPAPVKDAEPVEAEAPADAPASSEPKLRQWHGIIAPEAAPSGDRRQFAERALSSRSLPLPLKAMFVDDEGHKGSVVVGRIDNVYRKDGLIRADGVWDDSPEADRAYGMIERKMWRGVSVDVDAVEADLEGMTDAELLEFLAARISSATICAIPAFAQAFVANGGWENFNEATAPNSAMNEIPDWPEATSLVASAVLAPRKLSVDYFKNPMLDGPTPMTLGKDGHIFGHLAEWGACHIGFEVCTTAPPSATDYAYFLTGQVFTDAGPVAVGQITLGKPDTGGHAPDGISMRATIAHYDRTGTAVADITVGEDAFGIWFSGKLRNRITEDQLHELFAASLSGDWREVRFRGQSSMEMCAALAVNVPGFGIPRTSFAMDGERQVSLVAAGVLQPKKDKDGLDPEFARQMDLYLASNARKEEAAALAKELRSLEYSTIVNEFSLLEGK